MRQHPANALQRQIVRPLAKLPMYDNFVICNNTTMKTTRRRSSHVFTISFPRPLAKQVLAVAKKENRNISELFREAFRSYRMERLDRILETARAEAKARGPIPYTEDDVEDLVHELRRERAEQALNTKRIA